MQFLFFSTHCASFDGIGVVGDVVVVVVVVVVDVEVEVCN